MALSTTTLNSISEPQVFYDWVNKFLNKKTYICPAGQKKADAVKHPIKIIFEKVNSIPVSIKTTKILELNLLRACYLASNATSPELDEGAKTRAELQSFLSSVPDVLSKIKSINSFISEHHNYSLKAYSQTDKSNSGEVRTTSQISLQKLKSLEVLLEDFEAGLIDFNSNADHVALIELTDFRYGPFEFNLDLNKDWKSRGIKKSNQGVNVLETGLMFNLAYLFRYFSMKTPPLNQFNFFDNDILVIDSVRMLKDGKPSLHLVAAITNCVFETKYSSRDVKDRLDSMSKPTKAANFIPPVFIGW